MSLLSTFSDYYVIWSGEKQVSYCTQETCIIEVLFSFAFGIATKEQFLIQKIAPKAKPRHNHSRKEKKLTLNDVLLEVLNKLLSF
jgi:hypothetical protein